MGVIAFGLWSRSPEGDSGPVGSIKLGTVLLEPSTLIFVAEEQHLFSRNGLQVTTQYYETGLSAANAMLEGKVDLSGPVTEYVLVGKAFNDERIQTIGSIDRVDYASIVGRKDRGVETASDLRGKRIGVARGTMLEFRLGRFLERHDIKTTDVVIVNTALSKSVDAIASGDIDAVIAVPPYSDAAKTALDSNAAIWPAQSDQLSYQLLVGETEWTRKHTKLIGRFLNPINQAEEYVTRNPSEAKAMLQRRMNLTDDDVARIWSQNQFSLSLDQSLIIAMEDQARWMINNNLTTENRVPNLLGYIYEDALKAIKPAAVSIIR